MRSESLDWRPLTLANVHGLRGQAGILAIRADGKGYFGEVIDVTPEYVELANGQQRQLLRFFDSPTQFAVVKGPGQFQARLAERTLFKKGPTNG